MIKCNHISVNWPYFIHLILSAALSACFWLFAFDMVIVDKNVITFLATVFSILSGFLIAILGLSNTEVLKIEKFNTAETEVTNLKRSLKSKKLLFLLYLGILFLMFIAMLTDKNFPNLSTLLTKIYTTVSLFAFLMSFALPFYLSNIQEKKLEDSLETKRNSTSKLDRS